MLNVDVTNIRLGNWVGFHSLTQVLRLPALAHVVVGDN